VPVRRNIPPMWLWSCWLLLLTPAWVRGQEAKPELPAREAYLQGLQQLVKRQAGSLQSLFVLARAAAREQLQAVIDWDAALAAGKIPKKRFERILPGFHVGTADALFVVPNSTFFLELAKQHGNEVDRRFFELLDETFHGGATRAYINPLSETTACYQLGSREFISLYRGWSRFKPRAPAAYLETVNEELQVLEQTLLQATCACGTREIVDAGFEDFLKAFPKSPIAPQVRERLEKIHANTSGILFRCGNELDLGQPLPYGVPMPASPPASPAPPP
jgi:hypothetical protein